MLRLGITAARLKLKGIGGGSVISGGVCELNRIYALDLTNLGSRMLADVRWRLV